MAKAQHTFDHVLVQNQFSSGCFVINTFFGFFSKPASLNLGLVALGCAKTYKITPINNTTLVTKGVALVS